MGSALPEGPASHQADDVQQLRREIELTRERLGATVEQLAAKADLKSRARAQAAELAGRVKTAAAKARPGTAREKRVLFSVAAGAGLAVTALVIWQRRKR
jgi:ABC-type hemin transport system substrate-binding protein